MRGTRDHRQLDGRRRQQRGDRGASAACPEIGARARDDAITRPEVDMRFAKRGDGRACVRRSGEPYE
jgi:hypothetical protein